MQPYSNFEIQNLKQAAAGMPEAQQALDLLSRANGDLETASRQLLEADARLRSFAPGGKSTLEHLADAFRDSICGDAGILDQIKGLQKDGVKSGVMLSAVTALAASFSVSIALATFLLLWILRIGVDAYCRITQT